MLSLELMNQKMDAIKLQLAQALTAGDKWCAEETTKLEQISESQGKLLAAIHAIYADEGIFRNTERAMHNHLEDVEERNKIQTDFLKLAIHELGEKQDDTKSRINCIWQEFTHGGAKVARKTEYEKMLMAVPQRAAKKKAKR